MVDSHKPCPQHDDAIRHYVYTIGFYDIDAAADYEWDCVHNHYLIDCSWWTLDQMRADERMRAVNGDLIGTLELIERELLPAPSVAG